MFVCQCNSEQRSGTDEMQFTHILTEVCELLRLSLRLEVRSFLLHRHGLQCTTYLTPQWSLSPQALGSGSPCPTVILCYEIILNPSFRILIAAFRSLSITQPQQAHSYVLTSSGMCCLLLQHEQICEDGNHLSTLTRRFPLSDNL